MKKINLKKLNFLIPVIITCVIITIGYLFINGFPLLDIPEIDNISYIEISDHRLDVDSRKITEIEDIEMARKLPNLLLYKLGKPEQDEPVIELEFHLKDGKSFLIGANENTVCINGKEHSLKGDNGRTFIKVIEGIFFFEELVEAEQMK